MSRAKTVLLAFVLACFVVIIKRKTWDSNNRRFQEPNRRVVIVQRAIATTEIGPTTDDDESDDEPTTVVPSTKVQTTSPPAVTTAPPNTTTNVQTTSNIPPQLIVLNATTANSTEYLDDHLITNGPVVNGSTSDGNNGTVPALPRDCILTKRLDDKPQWVRHPADCKNNTHVVWLIKSNYARGYLRQMIRQTWAQDHLPLTKDGQTFYIQRIFVIGSEPNSDAIPSLNKEAEQYGDILEGVFADTQTSVTRKVFLGMRFIKNKCRQVKMIVVADDEAVFAPWNLFILLGEHLYKEEFYGGFSFGQGKPVRNKNMPWYIPETEYKCEYYPLYSARTVYFMSKKTLERIYYLGISYQMFPFDDVLMGGLAAESGIRPKFLSTLHYTDCPMVTDPNPSIKIKELIVCQGSAIPKDLQLAWIKFCHAPVARQDLVNLSLAYCEQYYKSIFRNVTK